VSAFFYFHRALQAGSSMDPTHSIDDLSDELKKDPDGTNTDARDSSEWRRLRDHRKDRLLDCALLLETGQLLNTRGWEREWYSGHLNCKDQAAALARFRIGGKSWFAQARFPQVPRLPRFSEACALAPDPIRWGQVQILFTSDHRLQITTPSGTETLNYSECELEDRRSKKPNKAWEMLVYLSGHQGRIARPPIGKGATLVEKRAQEIRRFLTNRCSASGDPLPLVDGEYRSAFRIGRNPSFED
jgi:hypothetical protein